MQEERRKRKGRDPIGNKNERVQTARRSATARERRLRQSSKQAEESLPENLRMLGEAVCRGYAERQKLLSAGKMTKREENAYRLLNEAVESCVEELCPPYIRSTFFKLLCEGGGYRSAWLPACGEAEFYRLKRQVLREIVRRIGIRC